MRVLVGYASAHGSTQGIAEEIGRRLSRAGLDTEVLPVAAINALGGYDAVVLGSAIHNMAWLPEAAAFVRDHEDDLARRSVWLFSVSSIGDTSGFVLPVVAWLLRRVRGELSDVAGFRRAIAPRGHRNFAGAIDRSHWNLAGDLFLRACGGRYGDHRDWNDIDTWADGIARDLRGEPG